MPAAAVVALPILELEAAFTPPTDERKGYYDLSGVGTVDTA